MRFRISKYAFLIALAGIIIVIVLKNTGSGQFFFSWMAGIPNHDKIGHFILMGGLSFLAVGTFVPSSKKPLQTTLLIIVLLFVGTGLEEISQIWVKNRTFSGWDYLCDFAGITCMAIVAHAMIHPRVATSSRS